MQGAEPKAPGRSPLSLMPLLRTGKPRLRDSEDLPEVIQLASWQSQDSDQSGQADCSRRECLGSSEKTGKLQEERSREAWGCGEVCHGPSTPKPWASQKNNKVEHSCPVHTSPPSWETLTVHHFRGVSAERTLSVPFYA